MMRDSRKLMRMQAPLCLLWANVGCLSMEPISSYSSGQREVADLPAALEPEPSASPSDGEAVAAEAGSEGGEQVPAAAGPELMEGLPGDGEVALEPGLDPGLAEQPAAPEPVPTCAAEGEFASSDGTRCYLVSSENAAWPDALASCESWGGSLVSIESREEDELLTEHMTATFWIAASDRVQEGSMFWSGGAPLTFTNWSPGQPDDFQDREDCVVKTAPAGTWNDRPCTNVIPYMCERSQD